MEAKRIPRRGTLYRWPETPWNPPRKCHRDLKHLETVPEPFKKVEELRRETHSMVATRFSLG